ncbi:MAG: hypothetical protein CM1200mP20_01610 [Pseudomonadota bacterium]|nr:MAG: hypothetical protein CM1200mP20_01610 [Pseudomonadota bacterium]
MSAALDIVEMARIGRHDVEDAATVYYDLGDRLGLHWLRDESVNWRWKATGTRCPSLPCGLISAAANGYWREVY